VIEYVKSWSELASDRRAVTALEYALMGSLIAVAIVTAVTTLAGSISTAFNNMGTSL